MSAKFLLPHRFKTLGAWLLPLGLLGWVAAQIGFLNSLFLWLAASDNTTSEAFALAQRIFLVITFFSFLAGILFLIFSAEKIEDELVSKIRLETFQLAAIVQLAYFIGCFAYFFVAKSEPKGDIGLAIFFLLGLCIFWLFFIARFNIAMRKFSLK